MKKVLVLEDEASIRSFIVINLQRAGYEVVEAECGEEALQKLQENPDTKLCLLDIMLPGIDGAWTRCCAAWAKTRRPRIPESCISRRFC